MLTSIDLPLDPAPQERGIAWLQDGAPFPGQGLQGHSDRTTTANLHPGSAGLEMLGLNAKYG